LYEIGEQEGTPKVMRIAILGTRGVPSGYSGYEAFAEDLGLRLIERGHAVRIYAHAGMFEQRPDFYRGMEIRYLPNLKGKNTAQFSHSLLATLHVLFSRTDVVLFCNASNGPFGLLLKLSRSKATAINVDGLEWLRPKWGKLAQRYFKFGAQCSGYFFDSVVTDAKGMQDIYREEFGVSSDDIAYGANPRYSQDPSLVRQFGLEPGSYYLIASRLVPDNNADVIIEGFIRSGSGKTLAIAGGTQYKNPFEDACRRMANDRVKFLGHIDDANVVAELHLNAFAYLHGHQFGGTNPALLKGLAYGNCVIALDTVFNREVLNDGEFGVLFQKDPDVLAKTLSALEREPEKVAALRSRSRERILQKYTWDKITDQYEALFTRILEQKRKTS
jgi:glycosyltransferase involved in cell wall biosynthesis